MRIEHVQPIRASIESVWQRTIDLAKLPDWLPTVTRVEMQDGEPPRVGSEVRIKQPGLGFATWTITEISPPCRFVWQRQFLGMAMIARHLLAEDGPFVINTLEIELRGVLARTAGPFLRRPILKALTRENQAFKQCCEQQA